jgi:hypothetical protein
VKGGEGAEDEITCRCASDTKLDLSPDCTSLLLVLINTFVSLAGYLCSVPVPTKPHKAFNFLGRSRLAVPVVQLPFYHITGVGGALCHTNPVCLRSADREQAHLASCSPPRGRYHSFYWTGHNGRQTGGTKRNSPSRLGGVSMGSFETPDRSIETRTYLLTGLRRCGRCHSNPQGHIHNDGQRS